MSEENANKFSLDEFFVKNQKSITIAAVILIALSAFLYYNNNYRKPAQEKEASTAAAKAEEYFRNDSTDLALSGGGDFMGLQDIADEYSNTKTGDRVAMEAASVFMKRGEYQEALDYLNKVDFSDELVAPLSVILKGDCHSELENYEKAVSNYMKAADMRDNNFSTPLALQKAARVYEKLDQWDKALEAYNRLKEDYDGTRFAEDVDKFIARAEAKTGA